MIARLYDENVAARNRAADRSPDLPSAERGRRLHQADVPAAPAGLERRRRARGQARAAREGLDATRCNSRHLAALGPGEEPRTAAADDRRARAAPKAWCRRRWRQYLPPGYTLARNVIPRAPGAPSLTSGSNPNANGQFTLAWEATQAATAPTLHAPTQERERWLEHRRKRPDEPRIHVHGRQPGGRRNVDLSRDRVQRKRRKRTVGGLGRSQGRQDSTQRPDGVGRPRARLRRWRRLVQGHGHRVLLRQRRPAAVRRQRREAASTRRRCPAPQTFNTDGSHEASGTVADNVGNVSAPGTLTRAGRRDRRRPSKSSCPAPVDRSQRRQSDGHGL